MISASIDISDLNKVKGDLERYSNETQDDIKRTVFTSAINVKADAKTRAPVDTGNLRASIRHKMSGDSLSAMVYTNVYYAPDVEFGTSKQRAQPYLIPALENEMPRFERRLKLLL
jgi:HK97 gp10 family phage protein